MRWELPHPHAWAGCATEAALQKGMRYRNCTPEGDRWEESVEIDLLLLIDGERLSPGPRLLVRVSLCVLQTFFRLGV